MTQIGKGQHLSPQTEFKKGHKTWNKGTKGLTKANKTSFKKGHNYKGIIKHQGYILLHKPNHPFCDRHGYVKRSRLIMEKKVKRFLKPKETCHHINHIRDDDRIKNLMLFPNKNEHQRLHEFLKK